MKNPKVGDRVIIYGHDQSMDYRVIKGWIDKLPDEKEPEGLLTIRTDAPPTPSGFGGSFRYAHPKQCRRLIKKKKPEPLRLWVSIITPLSQVDVVKALTKKPDNGLELLSYREFVEVVKPQKVVRIAPYETLNFGKCPECSCPENERHADDCPVRAYWDGSKK